MSAAPTIWTIGHSTRSADEFIRLLETHGVEQIADVRSIPKSGRHPQFNKDVLDAFLAAHGRVYRHFPSLGGMRNPRPDSINTAWRHRSFRGYADHMQTAEFRAGIASLLDFAVRPTAVMCAEAVWWRCHRQLLSDALTARNVLVRHIIGTGEAKVHQLNEFAKISDGWIQYPGLL
ncbi:MAG TPA: DUF488 domain-containing protein [Vicinamibacterales bacterium]|nr:DUF488 domain-containing protein [Vicinamibacterales bacterium]